MKVAVVGSRDYPWPELVEAFVQTLHPSTVILSGGSGVVDLTAAAAGRASGHQVEEHLANWKRGRQAGHERNRPVVANADVVVAFLHGLSPGTLDAIRYAKLIKRRYYVI